MAKPARQIPHKPYSTFPLFAHANGSWKKKIAGRQPSFGPWAWPDPDAYEKSWRDALDNFHRYEEAAAKGEQYAADPRSIELGLVCNGYLAFEHDRCEAGKIKPRSFVERREIVTAFRNSVGAGVTISELEKDPEPIRKFVKLLGKKCGYHRYNNSIQRLRSMFKWAAHPTRGVLGGVTFKWIDLFAKRELREFRRQRRMLREAGASMSFTLDEVKALIDLSPEPIRTYVLCAYFACYGNTDLGELPDSALTVFDADQKIHLHGREQFIPAGWGQLYFPRPKTELDRWAIVPPMLVKALKDSRAIRAKAKRKTDAGRQFLTANGRQICYEVPHRDAAGLICKTSVVDSIKLHWARQLARTGKCEEHGWQVRKLFTREKSEDGKKILLCPKCDKPMPRMKQRGFYCLRHTSMTRAAASGASSDTRDLFEGHSSGTVRQTFYLDPSQLHDLFLIARDLVSAIGLKQNLEPSPVTPAAPSAA